MSGEDLKRHRRLRQLCGSVPRAGVLLGLPWEELGAIPWDPDLLEIVLARHLASGGEIPDPPDPSSRLARAARRCGVPWTVLVTRARRRAADPLEEVREGALVR
jgi:hypothetical protein